MTRIDKKYLYLQHGVSVFKKCFRCQKTFEAIDLIEMGNYFGKWNVERSKDGLHNRCKQCHRELYLEYKMRKGPVEVTRINNYVRKNLSAQKKETVRRVSRSKYGSASLQTCAMCEAKADHWHHGNYQADAIAPLCRACHIKEHA